nr:hypothetical protein [Protofrankia symbiont of Coriaria ruscifolia]
MNDGLNHLAFWRLTHIENSGDDTDAHLAQIALGDSRVDAVSEDAVEVVDDYVVDVFLCLDPGEHLLKDGALVDICGRPSWLHEFVDDFGSEFSGLALACFALGGN